MSVAKALRARKRLHVVTNSIRAAEALASQPQTHVVLLGGELNATYGFTYGEDAIAQLGRYQPAWAILAVDGVNAAQDVATYHAVEAMIDRMMLQQTQRAIIAVRIPAKSDERASPACAVWMGALPLSQTAAQTVWSWTAFVQWVLP